MAFDLLSFNIFKEGSMRKWGSLLVFEGPDGAGKSTLANSFHSYLNSVGVKCILLAFPGNKAGTLGAHVYDFHHNKEKYGVSHVNAASLQLLHIAAHIDALEKQIIPSLDKGEVILLDRFWWSTWVYGTKSKVNEQALDLMIDVERQYWKQYLPDAVFLIDRAKSLRDSVSLKQWNKLRAGYYELQSREKGKYPIEIINNDLSPNDTLQEIIKSYEAIIKQLGSQKLGLDREPQSSQLRLDFLVDNPIDSRITAPYIYTALAPVEPSEVFDTYWKFAAERQRIFFKKLKNALPPWTDDPILSNYKFTNAYRASDRVSQYLIKHVIYEGEQSTDEIFFRTLLFKIFNKISTWELLKEALGSVTFAEYSFEKYDEILMNAINEGDAIFSAAYIMPSGKSSFGFAKKHRNYLRLLEVMIEDEVPDQLSVMNSMKEAFQLLLSYPSIGSFLAYQYLIDINYSIITDFSESEFVVPGPGAKDGIRKCFRKLGGLSETDIIHMMVERQAEEFDRLNIDFLSLWGRPLQLIDCQNLFCEVDKYARVAHPDIQGISKRKRIKQKYQVTRASIEYWYPPKWGINHLIEQGGSNDDSRIQRGNSE